MLDFGLVCQRGEAKRESLRGGVKDGPSSSGPILIPVIGVAAGRGRLDPCNSRDDEYDWPVPYSHMQQAQPIDVRKKRRRFEPFFDSKIGWLSPTFDRSPKLPHLQLSATGRPQSPTTCLCPKA